MTLPAESLDALHAKVDGIISALAAPPVRFLTVDGAAKYASLSTDTIRKLLDRGDLKALRPVQGRILIDRLALDRLVLGSTARPTNSRGAHLHGRAG